MKQDLAYDAFISHNQAQKPWVRRFVKLLRSYGVQTFFDEDDIRFGEDITTGVMRGLESSRKMILILSPESLKSRWVAAECLAKLYEDPDGSNLTIIPVLLKPVERNEIPLFIRGKRYVNLVDPARKEIDFKSLLRDLGITAQILPDMPDDISEDHHTEIVASNKGSFFHATPIASELRQHISIIGMGYVGTSLATAFANVGYRVVGVERDASKLDRLSHGESHLLEPGIDNLLQKLHASNSLNLAHSFTPELASITELVVICIGPIKYEDTEKEVWDTTRFKRVLEEIGSAIKERESPIPLNIVIAATIRPQDYEFAKNILEHTSNRYHGSHFILGVGPLFLREGSILADLQNPPFIIIGTSNGEPNKASKAWSTALLSIVNPTIKEMCKVHHITVDVAAMVKLASNTYHAMKVCFANEIGRICHTRGIDAKAVMSIFSQDKILNISELYLRPGFAFGGSCLGKDITGLLSVADNRTKDTCRLINSIQQSNNEHISQAVRLITNRAEFIKENRIGFFGLTFKSGTDDVRASPVIELINLLPRQYEIYATDPDLEETPDLTGRNRRQWRDVLEKNKITIANDVTEIISKCHILVIAKADLIRLKDLITTLTNRHYIIDLTGEISDLHEYPCGIYPLM